MNNAQKAIEAELNRRKEGRLVDKLNQRQVIEAVLKDMEGRRMKRADLARKAGINRSAVGAFLSGDYIPRDETLLRIAKALKETPIADEGAPEKTELKPE